MHDHASSSFSLSLLKHPEMFFETPEQYRGAIYFATLVFPMTKKIYASEITKMLNTKHTFVELREVAKEFWDDSHNI